VIAVLVDHNIEGQAALLVSTLATDGWLELGLFELITFAGVGLSYAARDRVVWQFVQKHGMVLLTSNRNMDGDGSLEQTIRDENQVTSLAVVTIADVDRIIEKTYREQCATRLAEIVFDLDVYLGAGRLYIP
jgi:hypothetical protein